MFRLSSLTRIAVVCLFLQVAASNAWASGSDFMSGDLTISSPYLYGAQDYKAQLKARSLSNVPLGSSDNTNSWLSVYLDNQSGTFGKKFSQVGLMTDYWGLRWFVYSEANVVCLRGATNWGPRGCIGDVNDLVSLNTWHTVELVHYSGQPNWLARVYNAAGQAFDVAYIQSASTRIYRANLTMEQAYAGTQDPHRAASFELSSPQFWTSSGFLNWPFTSGAYFSNVSAIDLNSQNTFCPTYYGGTPNLGGNQRIWFAGSGGQQCNWTLFAPAFRLMIPALDRYYSPGTPEPPQGYP